MGLFSYKKGNNHEEDLYVAKLGGGVLNLEKAQFQNVPYMFRNKMYKIAQFLLGEMGDFVEVLEYDHEKVEIHFYCPRFKKELVGFIDESSPHKQVEVKIRFSKKIVSDDFLDLYE